MIKVKKLVYTSLVIAGDIKKVLVNNTILSRVKFWLLKYGANISQ